MVKQAAVILPTVGILKRADAHVRRIEEQRAKIGLGVDGCAFKIESGESRYYKTPDLYAVVGRSMRIFWFERRKDGFFYSTEQA